MARALEQRWPINDTARKAIIGRLLRVIADPESSTREVTAASRAILSAEAQNQADEHKLVDVSISNRNFELDEIAREIGVDLSVVVDAESHRTRSIDTVEVDRGTSREG